MKNAANETQGVQLTQFKKQSVLLLSYLSAGNWFKSDFALFLKNKFCTLI